MTISTLIVFGTRPEAIKMAPVVKALQGSKHFISQVCITGQHDAMLREVLSVFNIAPHFEFQVMQAGQAPVQLMSRLLTGVESVLASCKPDVVLVHGDTTTTLAAALAAFYRRVPVAHVEAGLRTGDIYAPWPEEVNRKVTGILSTIHFAPTSRARINLLKEGVSPSTIQVTGNTVIDALYDCIDVIDSSTHINQTLAEQFSFISKRRRMILVTGHRRESFGAAFQQMCRAIQRIAQQHPDIDIVYPVHLNPSVQEPVHRLLGNIDNIYLLPPVDYVAFVHLMRSAYFILTDSGGIQEEAPSLGKPVLVMREKTERVEAIEAGTARLVGTTEAKIVKHAIALLTDESLYSKMSQAVNPYGDGQAAQRIERGLVQLFEETPQYSELVGATEV